MSFTLPYISKGRRHQRIELPDFYFGFVSKEDVFQLQYGLRQKIQTEPTVSRIRNSAILLAKHRKEHKHA